ncbi:MAG: Holliday junction resolvase RuvX [Patescibacteria group bacterium]
MRTLGVDYGEKRIGIAISDEHGIIASRYKILKNDKSFIDNFNDIVTSYKIGKIVFGLPLDENGEEGVSAFNVRDFTKTLDIKNIENIEIVYWNETLTTYDASLILKKTGRGKKEKVDDIAAQLILQDYLDSNS